MKKYIYIITAAAALCAGLAACTKAKTDEPAEPQASIFVNPQVLNLSSDASQASFLLQSNVDWSISSTEDWCTASPASGKADNNMRTITVTLAENQTYDDRTASLFITSVSDPTVREEIAIMQKRAGALIVSQNEFECPAAGDTIEIQIASNVEYRISMPNVDWVEELVESRALETTVKRYIIKPNDTYSPRQTQIRINEVAAGAARSESVVINQQQNNALILSEPAFSIPAEGGQIEIKVKSNIDFTVNVCDPWIENTSSRALEESILRFSVAPNESYEVRQGMIIIENAIANDTVRVSQEAFRIDEISFVDRNLSNIILRNYDLNNDGKLDSDEAALITRLELCIPNSYGIRTGYSIRSLDGLEHLRNLEYLDMARNSVANIDLSANTRLKYLDCSLNKAQEITVGDSLTYLDCSHNSLLSLDVSRCTGLTYLDAGENKISELDLSANTKLETLGVYNNYKFTKLDLSANTALRELLCYNNAIASLDLSAHKELVLLNCSYNALSGLDLSAQNKLEALYCSGNALTSLDVSGKGTLRSLSCDNNSLTGLKIDGCTALRTLYCYSNSLSSLSLSGLQSLEYIGAAYNKLTTLDASALTSLTGLYVHHNSLTSLTVSGCSSLNNIYCHDNALTSLDLSGTPALRGLHAAKNSLTALDLSANTALTTMYCTDNPSLSIITLWDDCDVEQKYFYKDASAVWTGGVRGSMLKAAITGRTWAEGDQIALMTATEPDANPYTLASGAGQQVGSFSGMRLTSTPWYAVYPASAAEGLSDGTVKVSFPSAFKYSENGSAGALWFGQTSGTRMTVEDERDITLNPLSAYIKLKITGDGQKISGIQIASSDGEPISGQASISNGTVSMASDGQSTISVSSIDKTLSATATEIIIPVAPISVSNPLITIYDNQGTGQKISTSLSLSLLSGSTYEYEIAYQPESLPTIDLGIGGIANCYIISNAGSYSIPAKTLDGKTLSGTDAAWVWMSSNDLISDVVYADGQIRFNSTGTAGNALVALLDQQGQIVWSWHIWCTETPDEQKWNAYTWLDRNVGATSATPDDVSSYGLLYQWGRKDPFIGANTIGGATSAPAETVAFQSSLIAYTIANENVLGKGNGWANIFGQSTEAESARWPMCLYTYKASRTGDVTNPEGAYGGKTTGVSYNASSNSTMADWCEGAKTDRWYNTSVTASGKTLNDPCPAGYMVPTAEQQNADFIGSKYFTSAGKSTVTNGRTMAVGDKTAWLPATGVRFSAYAPEGANKFIGNTAVYWNSGTGSTASIGAIMSFTNGNVQNYCGATMWKGFACPIRCVAESR